MSRKAYKAGILSAAALAVAMVAQAAVAVPITQWDYTILSGFSSPLNGNDGPIENAVGHGVGDGYPGDYTSITATDAQNRTSSISITGDVNGSDLVTNSSGVAGATFTHDNQTIDLGTNDLKSFNLDTQVTLTGNAPASESGVGTDPSPLNLLFHSFFVETDNTVGQANCSVQDGGAPCSDIFVLGNAGSLPGTLDADGNYVTAQPFTADDTDYTAFLTIYGLGLLDDAVCTDAGADSGCIGLTTMEDQLNNYTTNLRIVGPAAVPEPGSLAIMLVGLGLVGLGFSVRRRSGRGLSI